MGYEALAIEYEDEVLIFERKQINNGYYSDGVISVKSTLLEAEKNCTLAEEIGHYFTTHGNILDQTKIINIKKEIQARRWAYRKLLPVKIFIDAYERNRLNKYDMIEDHNVTEEFLDNCILYYKQKYGLATNIGRYTILFEPNLQIIKWF
jgi:hypothetical protein